MGRLKLDVDINNGSPRPWSRDGCSLFDRVADDGGGLGCSFVSDAAGVSSVPVVDGIGSTNFCTVAGAALAFVAL